MNIFINSDEVIENVCGWIGEIKLNKYFKGMFVLVDGKFWRIYK